MPRAVLAFIVSALVPSGVRFGAVADTPMGRRTNLPLRRRTAGGPLVPPCFSLALVTAGNVPVWGHSPCGR